MNNLKALRKEKHETQAQIAALMGINVKTVSRWENGEFDIKPAQARMLADYFNVSVGYLLGDTDDRFPYDDEKVIDDYVKYGLILT
ncbi:helix-turn-helix domain-containing protein, partial [Streptococcus hyointestinalis]